jgi:hypothetical protein
MTTNTTETTTVQEQLGAVLRLMEDQVANPGKYTVDLQEMVTEFRNFLTPEAIDYLNSDDIQQYVELSHNDTFGEDEVQDVINLLASLGIDCTPDLAAYALKRTANMTSIDEINAAVISDLQDVFGADDDSPIDLYPNFALGFNEGRLEEEEEDVDFDSDEIAAIESMIRGLFGDDLESDVGPAAFTVYRG